MSFRLYTSFVRKAFKFRLYPNRQQEETLDAMLETHSLLYNCALEERRDAYEAERRTVSYGEQSGKLKEARKSNLYLAKTNFSSTQATLRRLDRAFKAFFRRVKAGEAGHERRAPGPQENAVEAVLQGASWQTRCRVHFMRNALALVPKAAQQMVGATIRTVFAQPSGLGRATPTW
jgi:hypothetical protein